MKDLYLCIAQRIHPGSILVTVGFDLLWSLFEGGSARSVVGLVLLPVVMLMVFTMSFVAVTLIQKLGSGDVWRDALSKGLVLGALAAVPFSVVGVVAAVSMGIMRMKYGADEEVILLGKLTRSWREIELILRRMAPDMHGQSLDRVIDILYERRRLSRTLRGQLHELRRQRNINTYDVSTSQLASLVDAVQANEVHQIRLIRAQVIHKRF